MSLRYEKYRGFEIGSALVVWDTTDYRGCQSFTPSTGHYITEVWLTLSRWYSTTITYNITVKIYAADGNHKPTGSILAGGTYPANSVGTSWDWHRIPFTQVSWLDADTEYCIVVYSTDSGASPDDEVYWAYDLWTPDPYAGSAWYSSNGGVAWVTLDAGANYADFLFEEWGLLGTETIHTVALYGRALTASLRDASATLKLLDRTLTLGLFDHSLTLGLFDHSLTLKIRKGPARPT